MSLLSVSRDLASGASAWKHACRVVSTSNITLSGLQTIDGVALAAGDRVLVAGQTAGAQNGLYNAFSGRWTRTDDADQANDMKLGMTVAVLDGTAYAGSTWRLTSPTTGDISLNSTALTFSRADGGSDIGPTYAAVANHAAVTGVRTGAAWSIASSIDAAITDLDYHVTYDNGRAAAVGTYGKLPILIPIHGYTGSYGNITDAPKIRGADAGFMVATPNLRGRTGSGGTADDSARELVDIDDMIADLVSRYPTLADDTRVYILGYSGGGANAIAYAAKNPGRCVAIVALFGWGDYGVSPSADHSWWGYSVGDRTTIETRIGTRDALALGPYRVRNSLTNIAAAMNAGSTKLFILWDSEDNQTGNLSQDVVDALTAGGVPQSKWYSEKSTADSTIRWEHGYYEDNADLINAEYIIHNLRDEPAPDIAAIGGPYMVNGHCRFPDFQVWTAATGTLNPRTDSTGGRNYRVNLWWNTLTGEYDVEPIDGACKVLVRLSDGTEISKEVS